MLAGWKYSNAGRGPEFDIVTGISTGAILAPLVFIGDDAAAKLFYTNLAENDIYRTRSAFDLLTSNSLLDATPLQNRLREIITNDVVARIAAEGAKGRILAIQAVDLDLGDPVIFDLTAIAVQKSRPCGETVSPRDCIIAIASETVAFGVIVISCRLPRLRNRSWIECGTSTLPESLLAASHSSSKNLLM